MYNRYIPDDASYERVSGADSSSARPDPQRPSAFGGSGGSRPSGGIADRLGGLLKNFSAGDLDSGDILLILILVFLFLESDDNLELVIALGLLLLFGLFGKESPPEDQSPETV